MKLGWECSALAYECQQVNRAAAVEAFAPPKACFEGSKQDGLRKEASCARSNWDASSQGRLTALIRKMLPKRCDGIDAGW
jgi:hypothetical protein